MSDEVYAPIPLPIAEDFQTDQSPPCGAICWSDHSIDYHSEGKAKLRAPAVRRSLGPAEPPRVDNPSPAALFDWLLDRLFLWCETHHIKRRKFSGKTRAGKQDLLILALGLPQTTFRVEWREKRQLGDRFRALWSRLYGLSTRQTNEHGGFGVLWRNMEDSDVHFCRLLFRALDDCNHEPLLSLRAGKDTQSEDHSACWKPSVGLLLTWHTDFMDQLATHDPPVVVPEDMPDLEAAVILQKLESFRSLFTNFTEQIRLWHDEVDASLWGACAEFCGTHKLERRVHLHAFLCVDPESLKLFKIPRLRQSTPEDFMYLGRRPNMIPTQIGRATRRGAAVLAAGLYYVTADKVGSIARSANAWPNQEHFQRPPMCRRVIQPITLSLHSVSSFPLELLCLQIGCGIVRFA